MKKNIFYTVMVLLLTTIVLSGCAQHTAKSNGEDMHCRGLSSMDESLMFSVDPRIDPDWVP